MGFLSVKAVSTGECWGGKDAPKPWKYLDTPPPCSGGALAF
jgi:hypothetical protein